MTIQPIFGSVDWQTIWTAVAAAVGAILGAIFRKTK